MKVTILSIREYSAIEIEVPDREVELEDFMNRAGMEGYVLFAPKFFLLKRERFLEGDTNGLFFAVKLPK